MVWITVKI